MITAKREPRPATDRTQPKRRSGKSGIHRATGRDRAEWFEIIDQWGAPGRPYREIADWLEGDHGLTAWWAQKLIVEYEQERGLRPPGARPGGTFTVTASKTVAAPVADVYAAFVDADLRERWLPGAVMSQRTARPERSARFDWETGGSRANVSFAGQRGRCQVAVEHERLPDARTAEQTKAFWRERLTTLKTVLEQQHR